MKMAIEIVSFPIRQIVISHSYVNVYQRVIPFNWSVGHAKAKDFLVDSKGFPGDSHFTDDLKPQ